MRVVEYRRIEVKRDMDLIRDILLKVEEDPSMNGFTFKTYDTKDFEGHSEPEIIYHINLLFEVGFIDGARSLNPLPAISRLTWQGHEFIAATKDPRIWASVKERLKGLPDVGISVIFEIAKAEIKKHLKLP